VGIKREGGVQLGPRYGEGAAHVAVEGGGTTGRTWSMWRLSGGMGRGTGWRTWATRGECGPAGGEGKWAGPMKQWNL
jgi:hypothetical protein